MTSAKAATAPRLSTLLRHPIFRRLFAAQVVALGGTGLLTVALALLAHDLAGAQAGVVLGTVLTLKMVAYVVIGPIAGAVAARLPRRAVLIVADLLRAAIALSLPFLDSLWQIYALVLVLQAASAVFTPTFQATIPDVLPDEGDYTRALSLSRLVYDLESLLSPAFAGLLLLFLQADALFLGTAAGFCLSALFILGTSLPPIKPDGVQRPFTERLTAGTRLFMVTPRLRGLWLITLGAASVGAFVLVNTVVLVRTTMGADEVALTLTMAAFGAGSMVAALSLPRLLDRWPDRTLMLGALAGLGALAVLLAVGLNIGDKPGWVWVLLGWAGMGLLYSAALTPSGRLLRRSASGEERMLLFAAQFALSHAAWLLAYPFAGTVGAAIGLAPTLALSGGIALLTCGLAARVWRDQDEEDQAHSHPDLPPDHPHLAETGTRPHRHPPMVDSLHMAHWRGEAGRGSV